MKCILKLLLFTLLISSFTLTSHAQTKPVKLVNSVDMIWESQGYVPPFFKGKGIFAYQNMLHIVAVPHIFNASGKEVDPKTLSYVWKMGGKYVDHVDGYGRQSVDIQADQIPKTIELTVEISTKDGTGNVTGTMSLDPAEPSVSFYEEGTLYGMLLNRALVGKIPLKNSEMRVRAVPYGFNIDPTHDYISYAWSINNVDQPNLLKNQTITIRTKGDTEGSSDIGLDIRNSQDILQSARGNFSVYFSKKTQGSQQGVTF